ncbi:MAG: DEAD/DEAH box helicase [Hyphomicrobiaceae bacterium]|nr:MAG: DEAD/DEAH box helicase [Hyphomicrobiaceae bacterium]
MGAVRTREQLRDYQQECVDFLSRTPRAAIFATMGSGKSAISLTHIVDMKREFMISRVLVLSTKRIIRMVWPTEPGEWQHTKHISVSPITGTPAERVAALNAPADIHAINFENLEWLVQYYGDDWPFDMLVVDESSAFKSHDSNRFKALIGGKVNGTKTKPTIRYPGVLDKIRRIVLLTGTPSPKGLLDLWAQIYLLDRGARLGRNITAYRNRWFDYNPYTMGWKPKPHAQADIEARISDICRVIESYDGMPEVTYNKVFVDFPPKVRDAYEEFQEEKLLELKDVEITAAHAAALTNKLLQFSNGAVYDDDRNVHHIHDLKLDALEEIIEQACGKSVLVSYAYQHDLARLKKRFPKSVVLDDNPKTERDWNAGKIPLLIGHPKSCGHGLNLQAGGNIIVWFGLTWSLELYLQMNARLARSGQKERVIIHHLLAPGTIDERVLSVLADREVTQSTILANIKALIADRLIHNK